MCGSRGVLQLCCAEQRLSSCVSSCVQSALLFALVITEFINAVLLTQSNLAFEAVYFVISREVFNAVSSFVLAGHTKDSVQ